MKSFASCVWSGCRISNKRRLSSSFFVCFAYLHFFPSLIYSWSGCFEIILHFFGHFLCLNSKKYDFICSLRFLILTSLLWKGGLSLNWTFFFLLLYNDYVKEVKFRKDGNWYCCGTSFRDRILQQLKKMKPSSLTIIIQSRRRRSIFFSGSVFLFIVLDDNFENDKVKLRGLFLVAALQFANGTRKGEKRKCFILFFLSI